VLEDPLGLADYRAGIPPQLGQYAKPEDVARLGDFPALAAAAAADIPRARRVVVPECGHIPHLEHPDQFLAEFLPFLESR
jgi:pimeloyl-ACP methyl ester carboxylesterase